MKEKKTISVSVPWECCRQLDMLARESCRSRAGYLRRLIRAYLCYVEQHPECRLR